MDPKIIDPSLYCQFEDDQLVRNNRNYDDVFLRAGTDEWETRLDATLERLETTGNQQAQFTFAGMHISESDDM